MWLLAFICDSVVVLESNMKGQTLALYSEDVDTAAARPLRKSH